MKIKRREFFWKVAGLAGGIVVGLGAAAFGSAVHPTLKPARVSDYDALVEEFIKLAGSSYSTGWLPPSR